MLLILNQQLMSLIIILVATEDKIQKFYQYLQRPESSDPAFACKKSHTLFTQVLVAIYNAFNSKFILRNYHLGIFGKPICTDHLPEYTHPYQK